MAPTSDQQQTGDQTMTDTRTPPTDAELSAGLWTYDRWPENQAAPTVLVGTVTPYDTDDDNPDCVTLHVVAAPSGAATWTYGVPKVYVVRRTSLRPAYTEECADIADEARHRVYDLAEQLAAAQADAARFEAAYEQAWRRDCADDAGATPYEPTADAFAS